MSNETVRGSIGKAGTPPARTAITFPSMLEAYKGEIVRALPRHMNPDRIARIALTEFRKNPKLAECDPRSVFAAVIVSSQLGLEPGLLGQAYLIPYKSECQLIPGYQGLIDLVRRTGKVKRIESHVVRDGDKFTYKTGLTTVLEHEPVLDGPQGEMRFAYAVAEFTDGGFHVEVMTKSQIETIRNRSQGYQSAKKYHKETPWETDTEEMWRKTLIRRICKYLPKSAELSMALELDDAATKGAQGLNIDSTTDTWTPPIIDIENIWEEEKEKKPQAQKEKKAPESPKKEEPTLEPPVIFPGGESQSEESPDPMDIRRDLSKTLMEVIHLYPEKDRKAIIDHFFKTFGIQKVSELSEDQFEEAEKMIIEITALAPKKGA